jgi:hypothetical protein
LGDDEGGTKAFPVYVSGKDAYVARSGFASKAGSTVPICKNGSAQRLGNGRNDALAASVFVK